MPQFSILLVDDSKCILKALSRVFKPDGYKIHLAESAGEAFEILKSEPIDLLITDQNMPGVSGNDLLKRSQEHFPDIIRIMITGLTDIKVAQNAINSGKIYKFFNKPWDEFELLQSVRQALYQKHLKEENEQLKLTVDSQTELLKKLENEYPGITSKKLSPDGALIIEE